MIANESDRSFISEEENDIVNVFPLFEDEQYNQVQLRANARALNDHKLDKSTSQDILWHKVAFFTIIHCVALYGLFRLTEIKSHTYWYLAVLFYFSSLGVQGGAHRLWSHRSYKANFGLRLFLSLCFVMSLQDDLYQWARDHRVHHKYSETEADPHNANRGFFYSHIGWLMLKKQPRVARAGQMLDLEDLKSDPIVMFQRKYYGPLVLVFWGIIPAVIPVYGWNESWLNAVTVCVFFRHVYTLNITFFANSWSHHFGKKPYDRRLGAVDATIRHLLLGEGFHNYHHAFPWDYSTSEHGALDVFNPITASINLFAWMGWAWDLKKPNQSSIELKKKQPGLDLVDYKSRSGPLEWIIGFGSVLAPFTIAHWTLVAIKKLQ